MSYRTGRVGSFGMTIDRCRLGVDFGTSSTVAVLAWPDGRTRPLVFDGSELLPSAVCVDGDGAVLVGRDALHAARTHPGGFEPNPKRCIDDGVVLLGGVEIQVGDLIAAVLARVATEARQVAGQAAGSVVLTCPAGWGQQRRHVLSAAAAAAGLGQVTLVAEPVAAACYFARVAGSKVPVGSCAVVYDFGAGTFDASVVRNTGSGFEILAEQGLADAGGLDVDAAIVAHLGTVYADSDAQRWARLTQPTTAADRRAARPLWDDVRTGKEMLSRTSSTTIHVPGFGDGYLLSRAQLEQLARPVLDRTIRTTRAALRQAAVPADAVAGVFLVGGASRMPLAATLLHRALPLAPSVIERPELVVAEGALYVPVPEPTPPVVAGPPLRHPETPRGTTAPAGQAAPPIGPAPGPWPAATPPAGPAAPATRRPRRALVLAGALAAAVVVVAAVLIITRQWAGPSSSAGPTRLTAHATLAGPAGTDLNHVAFSPDGSTLVGVGGDGRDITKPGTVWLWDIDSRRMTAALTGHIGYVNRAAFTADGATLATASDDSTIRLWDVATHQPITTLTVSPRTYVLSLAFSPDGHTLVTSGEDGTVRLWDVTGRRVTASYDHGKPVFGVTVSPDGRIIASAGDDDTAILWDRTTQRILVTLDYFGRSAVRSVAFSPDGMRLAVGTYDGTIRLFSVATQELTATLPGHAGAVWSLAFSPDGKTLASAARENTARLWDVASGRTIALLTGHTGAVGGIAFSPDGRTVATASTDSTVRLWDVPRG